MEDKYNLISRSYYYKHLSTYFEVFDISQIKILLFRQLRQNARKFAGHIFRSLGCSHVPEEIEYEQVARPAGLSRSTVIYKLLKKLGQFVRGIGFPNIVGRLKTNRLVNNVLFRKIDDEDKFSLSDRTKTSIYTNGLKQDIEKLELLINKDLSRWKL
jgi:hypothetical protein